MKRLHVNHNLTITMGAAVESAAHQLLRLPGGDLWVVPGQTFGCSLKTYQCRSDRHAKRLRCCPVSDLPAIALRLSSYSAEP